MERDGEKVFKGWFLVKVNSLVLIVEDAIEIPFFIIFNPIAISIKYFSWGSIKFDRSCIPFVDNRLFALKLDNQAENSAFFLIQKFQVYFLEDDPILLAFWFIFLLISYSSSPILKWTLLLIL